MVTDPDIWVYAAQILLSHNSHCAFCSWVFQAVLEGIFFFFLVVSVAARKAFRRRLVFYRAEGAETKETVEAAHSPFTAD